MNSVPRELKLMMIAFVFLAAGVVLLVNGAPPIAWAVVAVGVVLDVVAVTMLVRRSRGGAVAKDAGMPGMIDRR